MLGGVSRQRVQQLIAKPDFPSPEVELNMGKVWKREDIEAWARETGRLPGAEDAPERETMAAADEDLPPAAPEIAATDDAAAADLKPPAGG